MLNTSSDLNAMQKLARDHHLVVMATRCIFTGGNAANGPLAEKEKHYWDSTCREWQVLPHFAVSTDRILSMRTVG